MGAWYVCYLLLAHFLKFIFIPENGVSLNPNTHPPFGPAFGKVVRVPFSSALFLAFRSGVHTPDCAAKTEKLMLAKPCRELSQVPSRELMSTGTGLGQPGLESWPYRVLEEWGLRQVA